MRLIDADALLNKICKKFDIPKDWDGDIAEPLQTIIDIIDNEPTAYDVEKVVEQLTEIEDKAMKVKNITVSSYACGMMHKAIDIVRKGGVE